MIALIDSGNFKEAKKLKILWDKLKEKEYDAK